MCSGSGTAVTDRPDSAGLRLSSGKAGGRQARWGNGMTQYSSSYANTEGHVGATGRANAARLNPRSDTEGSTVRTTASWAAGEGRRGAGGLACVVRQRTGRDHDWQHVRHRAGGGYAAARQQLSGCTWVCRAAIWGGSAVPQKVQKGTGLVVIIGGSRLAIGPLLGCRSRLCVGKHCNT